MTTETKPSLPPCARCQGRLFPTQDSGDLVCFSCGNVVYAVVSPALIPGVQRHPSHGGRSLG